MNLDISRCDKHIGSTRAYLDKPKIEQFGKRELLRIGWIALER
jgi:hypothetical protein